MRNSRDSISNSYLLLNIFITIGIIAVMNIITTLIFKIWSKSWLGEYRFNKNQGTIGQRYYERHPEHMPAACKAWGGPYPECRASCNVFDEWTNASALGFLKIRIFEINHMIISFIRWFDGRYY